MRRAEALTETDNLFRRSARELARSQEQAPAHSEEIRGAFVAAGWPGMALPEDLGGIGADITQCCIVLEEAGRALVNESVATDLLLAPRLAVKSEAVARLMPDLLAGKVRFAFAMPDEGGFARAPDGAIHGRSLLAPSGSTATHIILPVGSGEDVRLFLAKHDTPGLERSDHPLLDGRNASRFVCNGVSADMLTPLLSGAEARAAHDELRALAICGLVAEGLGMFEAAFDMTVDYVQTRKQFGQPLSAFQAVEHTIADVYCDLEKFRSLQMGLMAALETGFAGDWLPVARARHFHAGDVVRAVGRLIQVSGGIAMTEEYKLGRIYRRLQTDAALFGGPRWASHTIADAIDREDII